MIICRNFNALEESLVHLKLRKLINKLKICLYVLMAKETRIIVVAKIFRNSLSNSFQ